MKQTITELMKKQIEIAKVFESLPLQDKIDIIAKTFNCTTGKIVTSPCSGKWRGTSDIFIVFDSGLKLPIGNALTPKSKTKKVQTDYVNSELVVFNPEIIEATRKVAFEALKKRETKDNAIAVEKGLKPYTLLSIEFNDGENGICSYLGWYYVTLAVDGKICTHMDTGLNYNITDGRFNDDVYNKPYHMAGALKEADYVFSNVGFSTTSSVYTFPLGKGAQGRAEKALEKYVA